MENEIVSRVKGITKRSARISEENSGIQGPLENKDIEEYVRLVPNEKEKTLKGNNHLRDSKSDSIAFPSGSVLPYAIFQWTSILPPLALLVSFPE